MTEEIKSIEYMYRSRGLPDDYHLHHDFCLAFCIETGSVLYGNGMRFVSKRKAFYGKMGGVSIQNGAFSDLNSHTKIRKKYAHLKLCFVN